MTNSNLKKAKAAKNDEFYTQYADIQNEINAYISYNPDVFKGKTILLPCDDPEWSNFTKFFVNNFELYGLKKLISTSYAYNSKNVSFDYQPTLFESIDERFEIETSKSKGKIFTLVKDENNDGKIDEKDLKWNYLEGDGDFRSEEVKKLRDEADIIITNPPFSIFLEFLSWILEANKKFIIIGNKSTLGSKDVFPLVMQNKIWSGKTDWSGGMWFETKNLKDVDKIINGINMKNVPAVWLSNLEHGKRHSPLPLMTEERNIKYSRYSEIKNIGYKKYDNYDAIEVPYTDSIPSDYKGIMGVPITFLEKYSPEQFQILGSTQRGCHELVQDTKKYNDYIEYDKKTNKPTGSSGNKTNENPVIHVTLETRDPKKNYFINSEGRVVQSLFTRVFIKNINPQE